MKSIQIAIDGPSGAGKSTMAKQLSQKLGIVYLDTGAMYRALALKAIRLNIDTRDSEKVTELLLDIDIQIKYENGNQKVILDGEDVSDKIRTDEVSMGASNVSAIPEVRKRLVELQQKMASNTSVVMDGRDIGTHVLPNADVKIFLTASVAIRALRRYNEQKEKGILKKSLEEIEKEIEIRDYNDSHRAASPLQQADDAVLLDTSNYSIAESVEKILEIIKSKGLLNDL
ncbi:MAG: (d)CMP kinase [Acetivibrionales bacterium]|mgnify:FL=1|jgi:cytidylate kinase|nr:(d)CMP kinase [Clostridiaceae bacterium]